MTALRLPRRLLVGATSAALLGGVVGIVPLLGSASATCTPTYTDPAGDSAALGSGPGDDDLDIVSIGYSVDAGQFTATVGVKALTDVGPDTASGDIFSTAFTVAGKAAKTSVVRDFSGSPFAASEVTGHVSVGGTAVTGPVKVVTDLKASTVTISVATTDLEKAAGTSLAGKAFSAMTAETRSDYGFSNAPTSAVVSPAPLFDSATAPATAAYTFGGSCGGGAPTATGSPSPTGSGSPSPTPTPTTTPAPGGLFDQPRKNCVQYKDPTGDADPTGTSLDNLDNLDVTQVNLKSPAGQLQFFVGLVDPAASMDQWWTGPIWEVAFSVGGKAVTLTASADGPAAATVGGTANTVIKATAKVDAAKKNVVFTVPLDGLSAATATTIAKGTAITGTAVATSADSALGAQAADDAAGTTAPEKTYTYGDNTCFMPPAGVFTIDADPKGQYGDVTELFATLNDADGSPVQGVNVTAQLTGGKLVTATTDDDGIADVKLPLLVPAGTKVLTVSYAGDAEVGAVKATKAFSVVAEKTLLKVVASRGGASATVLDDDKHPVVGRLVTFTIGSTKKTVKTNSKGVAVLTGLAKGTAVKVVFLPVKNYYLGTATYSTKAL